MSFELLHNFVTAIDKKQQQEAEVFDKTIKGTIKSIQKELLSDKFLPSLQLKRLFEKLLRRADYPMEVAITGQFSSGKSTFLNALLQKDILPTGITPVTSKVNFINYGPKYKLKVTYLSGHEAFHPIEDISHFTDQRQSISEIKYLTLYAPMDILKDISFVDTPGLNSLSDADTTTTQKVLRDVDGIIWLTLIDNAGKESEAQTLKHYLSNFKSKSLCLLNQKDKFSPEQVQTSSDYVAQSFSDYFTQVIPISAKQALESRQYQKEILISDEIQGLISSFKKALPNHHEAKSLEFFKRDFEHFQKNVQTIQVRDTRSDLQAQEDSNILEVIDFIEDVIRPKALESKVYSIQQELHSICDILTKEYETIMAVYETLDEIHQSAVIEMRMSLETLLQADRGEFFLVQEAMQLLLTEIAHEIFINIKSQRKKRYSQSEKNLFGKQKTTAVEYESYSVDSDTILKQLFYDDQYIDKKIIRTMKQLQTIEDETTQSLRRVFLTAKASIEQWRKTYEYLSKQREIASDLEFANTRNFVARVYENFLSFYHASSEDSIAVMKKNFSFLKGAFSFNYRQVTSATIAFFEAKLQKSIHSYEKDPSQFSISLPTEDEILEKLKEDFSIQKLETFLTSNRSYMHNIINYAKSELDFIVAGRTKFLKAQAKEIEDKKEALLKIKASIEGGD